MTIDEAIAENKRIAEGQDRCAEISVSEHAKERMKVCADEHRQLAEWLMEYKDLKAEQNDQYVFIRELMRELKETKRLLKAAVYDIQYLCNNYAVEANKEIKDLLKLHYRCDICKYDANCKREGKETECCYAWRHYNEALKLIGEDETDG